MHKFKRKIGNATFSKKEDYEAYIVNLMEQNVDMLELCCKSKEPIDKEIVKELIQCFRKDILKLRKVSESGIAKNRLKKT